MEWIAEFAAHGWSAVHWSTVGDPRADDSAIMAWALANGHVVMDGRLPGGFRRIMLSVNTDTARDQRVDPVARFILALTWRPVSLVVDWLPLA